MSIINSILLYPVDGIKQSFYSDAKCEKEVNVNSISYDECDAVEETYTDAKSEYLSSNYQCSSQSDFTNLVPKNDLLYISNM